MRLSAGPSRRTVLLAACGLVAGSFEAHPADVAVEQADVLVAGRTVKVTRYLAAGSVRRPAVLLLHGSRGLDAGIRTYEQQARGLAASGIDACLFSYYAPGEQAAIGAAGTSAGREACYASFIDGWVVTIRAVGDHALKDKLNSGKVGLLGLSLGGFAGVAAASQPMFAALVAFYAGLPEYYKPPIASLPPLLAIHGDADRNVPLADGRKLVARAKALGGTADLVVYKGEPHGFNLHPANRNAAAANLAAQHFLQRWLAS